MESKALIIILDRRGLLFRGTVLVLLLPLKLDIGVVHTPIGE
jgi:hypothetical protein